MAADTDNAPSRDEHKPVTMANELVPGWCAKVAGFALRVALADGHDPRVVRAADRLVKLGITPLLVAAPEQVRAAAAEAGVRLDARAKILSPELLLAGRTGDVLAERLASAPADLARQARLDPLYLAAAAVSAGLADACVAGSARPSADVLRTALRVVGLAPGSRCVTSSFLMVLPDGRKLAYGDCAVIPEPNPDQLAEIAIATSDTFRALTEQDPVVALLSFSTKGSAAHASVETIRAATRKVQQLAPWLNVDGELQFDAALDESVGRAKANGSARAYGPILHGLAAPVNDLSRGCSIEDIVAVSAISALQARMAAARHLPRSRRTLERDR